MTMQKVKHKAAGTTGVVTMIMDNEHVSLRVRVLWENETHLWKTWNDIRDLIFIVPANSRKVQP